MMKTKYIFPAIIERDKISRKYTVVFPDLPGCFIEEEDFIQAYYWAGPKLAFHLYMMEREYEPIPEASDTSGWEIPAGAVVVLIGADRQEYRRMFGPKFTRKVIGFPSWLFQLGERGTPIFARDIRGALKEKLGIDMPPEITPDLSEVFRNEDNEAGDA